ncbi:MAG: hypothetical protein GC191_11350 [Azospirillum sp.]|nr:hypothetical protein [Azospirillum sp.]
MGAQIDLVWPGPVQAEHILDGRGLTLFFSRPFGPVALEEIAHRLPGWIDNVQYGYDSLLLTLAGNVAATIRARPDGVRVLFTVGPPTAETQAAESLARRRLALVRASQWLEADAPAAARIGVQPVLDQTPNDIEALRLLAQAEEQQGRWRQAAESHGRILAQSPDDAASAEARARLLHEHGDQARLEHEIVAVQQADRQQITRLSGQSDAPASDTSFRYQLEHRRVRIDQLRRTDGVLRPLDTDRQSARLSLVHDWPAQEQTSASLFLARGVTGAGISHGFGSPGEETRAMVAWHEPQLTFVEGVVDRGRRDRFGLYRELRWSHAWTGGLGIAINRYGVGDAADAAGSVSGEGFLSWSFALFGLPLAPRAALTYLLDAEYLGGRAERSVREPGPDGTAQSTPFAPLPLTTREVHTGQLSLDDDLTDYLRWRLAAGYAYDRRNEGAPYLALFLTYEPLADLEIGVKASQASSTARGSSNVVESYGGYVNWRY